MRGFYLLLPNIIVSLAILFLFVALAYGIKRLIQTYFRRRNRIDLGRLTSDIGFWAVLIIGCLVGLTVLIPSINPGDLISGLGIGSLAIGFVFKDIIQNWFSGLLILLRLPFRRGDQIRVGDMEGTVQRIEPRATVIRTYDGKDAVIPNNRIFSNEVLIQTSQPTRRIELDITVGYDHNINLVRGIITGALRPIKEILKEPEVQVLCSNLGATSLGLKIRWWIRSERSQEVISRARAIQAIKEAFQANDIDPTDPDLVYTYRADISQKDGAKKERSKGDQLGKVKELPPPPEFSMDASDPETYTPKDDSKNQTLLTPDNTLLPS